VAAEHWCSSGFASTDLDLQLKKHGIQKVIVMGLTSPGFMLSVGHITRNMMKRKGGTTR
jgi:hypothetical protein